MVIELLRKSIISKNFSTKALTAFLCTSIIFSVCDATFRPAFAKDKKVKVWVLNQKNRWGTYVICVNNKAIRINGSSGGVVLAKAPNWEVFVYHKRDKKYCTVPISKWIRKTNGRLYLPKLKQKPKRRTICGSRVVSYTFPINAEIDVTAGTKTIYKTRSKSTFVKDTVYSFDANSKRLVFAPTIVWNGLYEFPNSGRAPMESYYLLKDNTKKFSLTTSKQTEKMVSESVFERPHGLSPTKRPILSVFMGTGLMDATEFLFPVKK